MAKTMYSTKQFEVWRDDKRIRSMEVEEADERFVRSLYETGHIMYDANGRERLIDEIIHPGNRI